MKSNKQGIWRVAQLESVRGVDRKQASFFVFWSQGRNTSTCWIVSHKDYGIANATDEIDLDFRLVGSHVGWF